MRIDTFAECGPTRDLSHKMRVNHHIVYEQDLFSDSTKLRNVILDQGRKTTAHHYTILELSAYHRSRSQFYHILNSPQVLIVTQSSYGFELRMQAAPIPKQMVRGLFVIARAGD